jgi:sec-independent protein translocase protein TatC
MRQPLIKSLTRTRHLRQDKHAHDRERPFVEHLEDLRRTLIRCLVALVAGMLVAIPLTPWILDVLRRPLVGIGKDPAVFLRILKVAGGFSLATQVAVWSGVLLSAPAMVMAIGGFIFPGLTVREKRVVRQSAVLAVGLFAAGVVFCYFTTLPVTLQMMFGINSWIGETTEFIDYADYVGFALKLLLGFGLAFEMPVVMLALGSIGLITSEQLRNTRRYAVVAILIVAAVLTPPDVFSQVLMALPLLLLYEIGIWLVRAREQTAGAAA